MTLKEFKVKYVEDDSVIEESVFCGDAAAAKNIVRWKSDSRAVVLSVKEVKK